MRKTYCLRPQASTKAIAGSKVAKNSHQKKAL
jgi:hypothetical protein